MNQIELFENNSYSIRLSAKKKLKKRQYKNVYINIKRKQLLNLKA